MNDQRLHETSIEVIDQLIACHDEPTCPALDCAREHLVALRGEIGKTSPFDEMVAEVEREKLDLNAMRGKVRDTQGDLDAANAALKKLALYFTSSNQVPVEKATIKAEAFWAITGLKPEPDVIAPRAHVAVEHEVVGRERS